MEESEIYNEFRGAVTKRCSPIPIINKIANVGKYELTVEAYPRSDGALIYYYLHCNKDSEKHHLWNMINDYTHPMWIIGTSECWFSTINNKIAIDLLEAIAEDDYHNVNYRNNYRSRLIDALVKLSD